MRDYRARTIAFGHWLIAPSLPKLCGMILVFVLVLHYMPETWRAEFDPILLLTLAVLFTYLMFNLIRETQSWTMRGLGILAVFLGDAALYYSVSLPFWEVQLPDWSLDLARAAFLAGVIHLIIGSLDYELHRGKGYQDDSERTT